MATRANFSDDEWNLLQDAALGLATTMLATSRSGVVGKLRELAAMSRCLWAIRLPKDLNCYEVVRLLARDVRTTLAAPTRSSSRGHGGDMKTLLFGPRHWVLPICREVAAVLALRVSSAEAAAVKRWLMWIARRIACAAGDGPLGTGKRLSQVEHDMLEHLAAALQTGVTWSVPDAVELESLLGLR